jgi:hypothetical protein
MVGSGFPTRIGGTKGEGRRQSNVAASHIAAMDLLVVRPLASMRCHGLSSLKAESWPLTIRPTLLARADKVIE